MTMKLLLTLTLFPLSMFYAAFSDIFTMRISNSLNLILIAGFAIIALVYGLSFQIILQHLGVALFALLCTMFAFYRGWMGGGDAKMVATIALWLGPTLMMPFALYASLFGGALTLFIIHGREYPLPSLFHRQEWALKLHAPETGIPYGVALSSAAIVVFPQSIWFTKVFL